MSLRLTHHKEPQCGNPPTERSWRADLPTEQVVGQQLPRRQGQVFSCAATQPQRDVFASFSGAGPGNPAGRPGTDLQESQELSRAEGMWQSANAKLKQTAFC